MLQFEIVDTGGKPVILRGTRVLIRDVRTSTPVCVAAELNPGLVMAAVAKDTEDFRQTMETLGLENTVLITQLDKDNLPRISI